MFSTLAHIGFIVGIVGVLYSWIEQRNELLMPYGVTAGVCYGVLWLEIWCSHDFSYITSIKSLEEFKEYMSTMHAQRPEISMSVECYHYETRYRTVYYTDSNGEIKQQQQQQQQIDCGFGCYFHSYIELLDILYNGNGYLVE